MPGDDHVVDIHYLKRRGLNVSRIAEKLDLARKKVREYLRDPDGVFLNAYLSELLG